MLEIIPNWHPVFVHFTVALFSLSVGLFLITPFIKQPLKEQWLTVARWTLWFGAGFTVITGLTGLYAYNTVAHDTPSHAAMTDHRNWAIVAITLFLSLAVWSISRVRHKQVTGTVFIIAMVIAGGVLASTAWRGGEVVYRYGLGVMSLPKSEGEGHAHEHADGGGHSQVSETHSENSATGLMSKHHDVGGDHDTAHSHDDTLIPGSGMAGNGTTSTPGGHNDEHTH